MSTQTIDTLPIEILENVFDRLLPEDLRECEVVCRAWYPSAHRSLQEVFLTKSGLTTATMKQFMKYNPSTLNHLKRIRLRLGQHPLDRFDPRCASLLFKSLKNLEQLDMTRGIVDEIVIYGVHKIIGKSCPHLKKVSIKPHYINPDRNYHILLNELRESLTHIRLASNVTGLRALSSFPCLEDINVWISSLHAALEDWLPLFSQKFTLKSLTGYIQNESEDDFMNKFMQSETQEVQDLIIKNLSKLETLNIVDDQYSSSSIQFIIQYLTGLKYIRYKAPMKRWNNEKQELFWGKPLDYICNVQNYNVEASIVTKECFSSCLSSVLSKGFQQIPSNIQCVQRTVKILVSHIGFNKYGISIESTKLNNYQTTRSVKLKMPADNTLIQLVTTALTINSIDTLKVEYAEFSDPTANYIYMIQKLLDKLRMVKRITIVAPPIEKHKPKKLEEQYTQVTHLQLAMGRVYDEDKVAYDVILHMFPKIRYLKLYYLLCTEIEVPYYLDVLYLDVAELLEYELVRETYTKVLLVVNLVSKDERHFYTIPVGKLTTTSISEEDALNIEEEESTRTFRVRIPDVQLVILYFCRRWRPEQDYMDDCPEEIVEAKLSYK